MVCLYTRAAVFCYLVWVPKLWDPKLWDLGVKGRMWRVIKKMYEVSRRGEVNYVLFGAGSSARV